MSDDVMDGATGDATGDTANDATNGATDAAPRFPLREEYLAFARRLRARLEARGALAPGRRTVIGVAGESGSGKSITAVALAQVCAEAGIASATLHQDDYFRLPPRTNHEHRRASLAHVGPHEVELDRLAAQIAAFRAGEVAVEGPLVDYPNDRFVSQRHVFAGRALLIVEGTYVLRLPDLDVRLFLEATHEHTRDRRRRRARDLHEPFVDEVLAIEHALIAPQRDLADLVIAEDFTIR